MKSRASELIVMISRTAAENGADEEETMLFNHICQKTIPSLGSFSA